MSEAEDPGAVELRTAAAEALRTAELSSLFQRALVSRMMGVTFDGLRDIWKVFGYKDVVTTMEYRAKYARGGIASRVIDAKPKAVWRGTGSIYEDEDPDKKTPFEIAWDDLNQRFKLWSVFQRAHILASIGGFSIILIGGAGDLSAELPRALPGRGRLLYLTPYGGTTTLTRGGADVTGADLTVQDYDEVSSSPRFGQPKTYLMKRTNFSDPGQARPVHWTRVLHIPADGFLDDAIFGPPALEAVWNYLDDLDKVVGGGSEAFFLRANQGLHVDIDKKMAPEAAKGSLDDLKDQLDKYAHNMSKIMRTRGVNIETLGSDVADFKNPADTIITLIAGTKGIPKRILTGSEMGELASGQDRNNWNDQVQDCRTSYAEAVLVRPFHDRLIEYGYLPRPAQYEVEWPDVASMTELEKLDAATKAVALNDHGEIIITSEEIRETYLGREPLDDAVLAEYEAEQVTKDKATVDKLEAALRKGGTLSLAVRG